MPRRDGRQREVILDTGPLGVSQVTQIGGVHASKHTTLCHVVAFPNTLKLSVSSCAILAEANAR